MPVRQFGSEKKVRPGLLQLMMAVALLLALALGALAAAIFLAFPCPCIARDVSRNPPPNPKFEKEPVFQLPDGEKVKP